jgi:hypothetical protein
MDQEIHVPRKDDTRILVLPSGLAVPKPASVIVVPGDEEFEKVVARLNETTKVPGQ